MQEFFLEKVGKGFDEPNLQANLAVPLRMEKLLARQMSELSGGELQKVAIVTTFAQEADLYALDEPSAFVDVEDRFVIAKAISRLVKAVGKERDGHRPRHPAPGPRLRQDAGLHGRSRASRARRPPRWARRRG